jgi:hypothetical protein
VGRELYLRHHNEIVAKSCVIVAPEKQLRNVYAISVVGASFQDSILRQVFSLIAFASVALSAIFEAGRVHNFVVVSLNCFPCRASRAASLWVLAYKPKGRQDRPFGLLASEREDAHNLDQGAQRSP